MAPRTRRRPWFWAGRYQLLPSTPSGQDAGHSLQEALVHMWRNHGLGFDDAGSIFSQIKGLDDEPSFVGAIDQGDLEAVEEMYSFRMPSRSTILASTLSADRLLGRLAQALGRGDDANQHFQDALKFCRDGGYWPELAWSAYDYAESLVVQSAVTNSDQAPTLLNDALSTANHFEMASFIPKMQNLLENSNLWLDAVRS